MKLKIILSLGMVLSGCSSMDSVMRRMAFDKTLKIKIERPDLNEKFKNKTILLNNISFTRDGASETLEDKYQSYVLEKLRNYYPNTKLGISENFKTQLNNYLTGRVPQKTSDYSLDVEISAFSSLLYPNLKPSEYSMNTVYKIIENRTGNVISIGTSIVTSEYSDALVRSTDDAIMDLSSTTRIVSFPDAGFDETPGIVISMINSKRQPEAIRTIAEQIKLNPENESNLVYLNALVEISKGNRENFESLLISATNKGYSRSKASEALLRSKETMRILNK